MDSSQPVPYRIVLRKRAFRDAYFDAGGLRGDQLCAAIIFSLCSGGANLGIKGGDEVKEVVQSLGIGLLGFLLYAITLFLYYWLYGTPKRLVCEGAALLEKREKELGEEIKALKTEVTELLEIDPEIRLTGAPTIELRSNTAALSTTVTLILPVENRGTDVAIGVQWMVCWAHPKDMLLTGHAGGVLANDLAKGEPSVLRLELPAHFMPGLVHMSVRFHSIGRTTGRPRKQRPVYLLWEVEENFGPFFGAPRIVEVRSAGHEDALRTEKMFKEVTERIPDMWPEFPKELPIAREER
jgi:hypothetical protein